MKSGTITGLLGGVIVAGFTLGAYGEIKENPYQVIIDRNPFGLRTPPPPPPPVEVKPPEVPPPEIKLTGITTLLGPPRALLEFTDPQTKKVDRPSPFEEGDKYKDNIEIVSIDPDNQKVRIKIGEAVTTLDFEKNGIKPSTASAAPVPHPGLPGVVNPAVPPAPAAAAVGGPQANFPYGSGRSIVSPAAASTYNPAAVANNGVIPPRPVRTDTGVTIQNG